MGQFFSIEAEHRSIVEGITTWRNEIGQVVLWYEFDRANTLSDPVYDEGGMRRWFAPKRIPVYSVIRVEASETPDDVGLYTVDSIHITALIEQIRKHGLTNPYDAKAHLNDRFVWDSFVWEIRRYQIQGRVKALETTVGIDATKVSEEEMVNDVDFQGVGV